jgi:hypothetical protein
MGGDVPRERAWAWAAGWAVLLAAAQASAANLVEVRVGRHADFTRVVLETDAPVRYELGRGAAGELRVRLFAEAEPRRLGSKSPLLREVVVESDPAGSVARLALKDPTVEVREMVLQSPPRIVLDLVPGARAGRKAAPAVARAEAPSSPRAETPRTARREAPAPPPAEPAREAAAETRPEQEPASEPAPVAALPAPAAEPTAGAAPDEPERTAPVEAPAEAVRGEPPEPAVEEAPPDAAALEKARDAAAQAELDRLAGVPPPPPQPTPAGAEAGHEPGAPGGTPGSEEVAAEPEQEGAGGEAAGAEPEEAEAGVEAMAAHPFAPVPPPPPGGALSFLPSPLDDPLVLGAVAVLGALVGVLVILRRRAGRGAEEALASPFAAADAFALPERGEGAARESEPWAPSAGAASPSDASVGPLFASAAAAEPEPEKEEPSIFDVAEEAVRAADPTPAAQSFTTAEPRAAAASPGSLGSAALEGDVMRIIEELERRLAHLETRLEEVVDAKERLERHVAAQTEELRVQRAAIARTQRVLRTVVKPEDLATEPIPKT